MPAPRRGAATSIARWTARRRILSRSMTNPDSFSFNGATWFDAEKKYQRRAFKDYMDDGPLNQQVTGGWVAMLQHHFFTAWIPQKDQAANYSLTQHARTRPDTRPPARRSPWPRASR
jgi:YidC/Oxa1 family membrane protein insertase